MSHYTSFLKQATAEQIRLAQMISDHNDADFEEKVKQVSRYTEQHPVLPNHPCLSFLRSLAYLKQGQ